MFVIAAMYLMMILLASVLPAPLSPLKVKQIKTNLFDNSLMGKH